MAVTDIIPLAEIDVEAFAPTEYIPAILDIIPLAEIDVFARNPTDSWAIPARLIGTAQTIYKCILTGADDGLDDITLPISSFQARLRDGDPSYLACVVPDSLTYAADIASRSNGDISVQKGVRFPDGTEQMEEIARVHYEGIQINRGAYSDSITITGYKQSTNASPKEWTISGVSFYGLQSDGKRRIRAALDLFLRVGDTCIYGTGGNDYFTVGQISYWVAAKPPSVNMEVQEA
jgi:hypothetical protein